MVRRTTGSAISSSTGTTRNDRGQSQSAGFGLDILPALAVLRSMVGHSAAHLEPPEWFRRYCSAREPSESKCSSCSAGCSYLISGELQLT
jgi:hypothetical protein